MEEARIRGTVNSPLHLIVPERGHLDISATDWKRISAEPLFWRLVEEKIIKVTHPSTSRVRLDGSCYVGRASFSGILLELIDKVEGALAALLGAATRDAFKVERTPAPRTTLGPTVAIIIDQYLRLLRTYASRGREATYTRRHEVGSLVGGRLELISTIHLHARGLRHLLAFERTVLTRNTSKNQVLLAATVEIERIARLLKIGSELLSAARGMAMLFDDCRSLELLYGNRSALVRRAEALSSQRNEPDRDLLSLAAVILEHASFEVRPPAPGQIPRSWFLNLETLFEARVRDALSAMLPDCDVFKGGTRSSFIFPQTARYEADPDIVIRAEPETFVGDAKYKEWHGTAESGDLYQLLAHAGAFRSKKAFLVYPADKFEFRVLGKTGGDIEIWLFAIDVRYLERDLGKCLETLGIRCNGETEKNPDKI